MTQEASRPSHLAQCGSGGPPPLSLPGHCPIPCDCPCHLNATDDVAKQADATALPVRRP